MILTWKINEQGVCIGFAYFEENSVPDGYITEPLSAIPDGSRARWNGSNWVIESLGE